MLIINLRGQLRLFVNEDGRRMPIKVGHVEIEAADKIPYEFIVIAAYPAYPKRNRLPIRNIVRVRMGFQSVFEPIKW